MVKKALIFLIEGCDETELVNTVAALRKADVECIIGGVGEHKPIQCAQYVRILPDVELARLENEIFDAVIVPGGPGADKLTRVAMVGQILKSHYEKNCLVCGICAGFLA